MANLQNDETSHDKVDMGVDVTIDGIRVQIEGTGVDTILMVHGWPDTLALWDRSVATLKGSFRCARFTLPGYDKTQAPRPTSVADMTALIAKIVEAISPTRPVVLMCHDWGCFFGYEFVARHPQKVQRLVGVDIGDHNRGAYVNSLRFGQKMMVLGYQMWLAIAWKVGENLSGSLGTRMTRWMARSIGFRGPPGTTAAVEAVSWQMCYPYAMRWMGLKGGFKGIAPFNITHPTLFVYGQRKPFMFHSPGFLQQLAAHPGSEGHGLQTGHWVMVQKPEEFNRLVIDWLAKPLAVPLI